MMIVHKAIDDPKMIAMRSAPENFALFAGRRTMVRLAGIARLKTVAIFHSY